MRLMLPALAAAIALAGCHEKPDPKPTKKAVRYVEDPDAPEGLHFTITETTPPSADLDRSPVAKSTPLSKDETQGLLARLPAFEAEKDERPFAIREDSLPAPRTGETIEATFPPPPKVPPPPAEESGPLKVIRYAPEGNVHIAPQISVTFSQPMVPITSHDTLAAKDAPITVTPMPKEGKFRWIGTKTILFEAGERLPMATEYTVEIPAGTKSMNGGALAAAKKFTFRTPTPVLQQRHPQYGPHPLEPVFFASFDQAIDPDAVLATTTAKAAGKPVTLRKATQEEIADDKVVKELVKQAQEGRWVAFRATAPLPPATGIRVEVGPKTPSQEGPRTTAKAQGWSFNTYHKFRIQESRCGWYGDACRPQQPFSITFNNPLTEEFDPAWVTVDPPLEALRVNGRGYGLSIRGRSKARTTYTVTLSPEVQDSFGQKLGKTKPRKFAVGSARPSLSAAKEGFLILDPAAKGTYSVFSVNFKKLRVQLYKVKPEDFTAFSKVRGHSYDRVRGKIPGKKLYNKVIEVEGEPDEMVETPIDLTPALNDSGFGQAVVTITHVDPPPPHSGPRTITSWIQLTHIGVDAFVDSEELVAWATRLDTGEPLEGVEMELLRTESKASTGKDGLATLPLGKSLKDGHEILIARTGDDMAILPDRTGHWGSPRWYRTTGSESLRWYVFNDRGMYRPKEEVHIKGWLRKVTAGEKGVLAPLGGAAEKVEWTLEDARRASIGKGNATINAMGAFHFDLKLPDNANLGTAYLTLRAKGGDGPSGSHTHRFQIQEFRRPEFEVSVSGGEGPHFIAGSTKLTLKAAYYAGGGLPNADANWQTRVTPGAFRPPNLGKYAFGAWVPWWRSYRSGSGSGGPSLAGKTDSKGEHHVELSFLSAKPARPFSLKVEGTVRDVNRQRWTGSKTILVHPADLYLGLKPEKPFVDRGTPLDVDAVVADLDGQLADGVDIKLEFIKLHWKWKDGTWEEEERVLGTCTTQSDSDPVTCNFDTPEGGSFTLRGTIQDANGRPSVTETRVWVSGGKLPPQRDIKLENLTLVPNKPEYAIGETAELLVQSPFVPAEGLLTLRRRGIIQTRRFRMDESTTTLKIPVEELFIPNLHVQVNLVGAAPRIDEKGEEDPTLPKRPAYAQGTVKLSVPPVTRTLAVEATPKLKALAPGGKTEVTVNVRDAAGKPVKGAEVAVVVVDEAILALSGYQLVDPLSVFYTAWPEGVRANRYARGDVLLANPEALAELGAAPGAQPEASFDALGGGGIGVASGIGGLGSRGRGGGGGMAYGSGSGMLKKSREVRRSAPRPKRKMSMRAEFDMEPPSEAEANKPSGPQIKARVNFNPLALFEPGTKTDAQGATTVKVSLPDNLTRYRVMAVAAQGTDFGTGESSITARLPLMIRPSPPRFLNYGDQLELPVVLQNQTDEPLEVSVAIRAQNAEVTGKAGQRLRIPAGDRVEVRFPSAAGMPGTARFQIGAATGDYADAATVSFPVWTPATKEAFATYGEVDDGSIIQPVEAPHDAVKEFGGLEVTTSSTALQALTDAVIYLVTYPYECAEQISSRVLGIAALRDVLEAFDAEGLPPKEEIEERVNKDLKRLRGLQKSNGGFALWYRDGDTWPYVSVHATHALIRAKEKGFEVPDYVIENSKRYLRDIEYHTRDWLCRRCARHTIAYATYVMMLAGEKHPEKAKRIIAAKGLDGLTMESLGWILPVLTQDQATTQKIRRYLTNRVAETAAGATFATGHTDGDYLIMHSSRRADAVLLDSMVSTWRKSDLIPKLVRGLLGHKTKGRWNNTQENVFVLLAMDNYFKKFESVTPDFVARAWLGDRYAGEHTFKGRTTERHHIDIAMPYVFEKEGKQNLILSKDGPGRMYYRIGMRYAPQSLDLAPADHGFTVTRTYEAVEDPNDVTRDEDGTWRIKAGTMVRVRLALVAPSRRYHVALVDPLPAGLEAMNPALKVTGSIPQDPKEDENRSPWWWWGRPWFEHQNMRDERVEAFTSLLWAGVHRYTYVAQATTPGKFVVPPTRAEEMYHPETFGRSGTEKVVIE